MSRQSEFVAFLLDQLAALGEVSARAMFGGFGLYCDGRIFAIVAWDTLYVKVDDATRAEFERAGCQPFRYEKSAGEVAVMSYYAPPAAAIDDRELLCAWARKGVAAAERAATRPKKKRAKK